MMEHRHSFESHGLRLPKQNIEQVLEFGVRYKKQVLRHSGVFLRTSDEIFEFELPQKVVDDYERQQHQIGDY